MARGQLILDRYELLGTAGAGGFGTVRIAWDPRIQRKVAIKTIGLSEIDAWRAGLPGADAVASAGAASGGPTADRWHGVQPWNEYLEESWDDGAGPDFPVGEQGPDDLEGGEVPEPITWLAHLPGLDEARTAAKLQDTRIVGVYDFEVRGQIAYLIMEYVEGITLTRLLADYEDYLTLDVVAAVFDTVAGALAVAHKAGVLHLDIKPDNILINADGQAKVTDFGLATLADASGTGTAGGGTIGYMPLEQMRREPLDARSDEWSLASVLYEMLTGENPFLARDLESAEKAIENAELILPSLCWDDIDDQIDDVVFFALDPDPDRRYATVRDFAEEADKFLGDASAGKNQLAVLVSDALGIVDEEDDEEDDGFDETGGRRGRARGRRGLLRRITEGRLGDGGPLQWARLITRVTVAGLVAYLAFSAVTWLYPAMPIFGQGMTIPVAIVCALALGAVGAIWPHGGVLAACIFAGFELIVGHQWLAGAVLAVSGLVWWYAFMRLSVRSRRPVLLGLVAVLIGAALVAVLLLVPVPEDFVPVLVVAIVAVLANAVWGFLAEREA